MQDDYANHLSHLDIHRGIKKTRCPSDDLKKYGAMVAANAVSEINPKVLQRIKLPEPDAQDLKQGARRYFKKIVAAVHKFYDKRIKHLANRVETAETKAKHYQGKYERERAKTALYSAVDMTPDSVADFIESLAGELTEAGTAIDKNKASLAQADSDIKIKDNRIDQLIDELREAKKPTGQAAPGGEHDYMSPYDSPETP
jgi:chromosome segregation ATPase